MDQPVIGNIVVAPLENIELSENRQRIDEGNLAELGESMERDGQFVACEAWIPEPGRYRLKDGGRRYKAAKLRGIERLRLVIVEEPSIEEEVMRQLAPQGQPLHPLDEARLYHRLRGLGASEAEIAGQIGRPAETVTQRLMLIRLCSKVHDLYAQGRLSDYVAFTLARMTSHPEVQERAARKVIAEHIDDTRALRFLRRLCVLPLAIAPWGPLDNTLNPKAPAPTCAECPERTLAQRDLWGDLYDKAAGERGDFCLNDACFRVKLKASAEKAIAEAREKKIQIVKGGEAKKLCQDTNYGEGERVRSLSHDAPWIDADHVDTGNHIRGGTLPREIMGRDPDALMIDPDGWPRWLYDAREVKRARNAEEKAKTKSAKKTKAEIAKESERRAGREKERKAEIVNAALIRACAARAKTGDLAKLVKMLTVAIVGADNGVAARIAHGRGLGDGAEQLEKLSRSMDQADARALLAEIVATMCDENDYQGKGKLAALAKSLGVDVKATGNAALKRDAEKE